MNIRLSDHFDKPTLQRGRDYARRGLVGSVEALADGTLGGRVSNGRGNSYRQRITLGHGLVDAVCSCPVGHNCKHVAAVLVIWAEQHDRRPGLAAPVLGWLDRVRERSATTQPPETWPEDYPDNVKDRLLYVLAPHGPQMKIDVCKGRINAAGAALNKGVRRYDALHALRSAAPARFIRPADIELLSALAQARLWDTHYSYGLPDILRPKGESAVALLRRLCDTGRFLHDNAPDAQMSWSDTRPEPRLGWRLAADGGQRLGFEDASGQPLDLRALGGATLWIDRERGKIGALEDELSDDVLRLVDGGPEIAPHEVEALGAALPDRFAGLALPRPRSIRQSRRAARQHFARLTLGAETARSGPRYWGGSMQLPTLTLRFVYDGQEVCEGGAEPSMVAGGEIVTLARDHDWEAACAARLMGAGALQVDELEGHWPCDKMMNCDFVFADGEMNLHTLEISEVRAALDFAFRTAAELRREGWEVIETAKWPYRLSGEAASLTVATRTEAGEAFQGNDWFSLGFQAEIGGSQVDVALLLAAFLEQIREEWDDAPDVATLAQHLAGRPVYLNRGKQGYVAVDLSPLAPLLHLFLTHHAEMGALHPSDARVARLAEEALAGSSIRFSTRPGFCRWRAASRRWTRLPASKPRPDRLINPGLLGTAALSDPVPHPHREAWRRRRAGPAAPLRLPPAPHQGEVAAELPPKTNPRRVTCRNHRLYETVRSAMDARVVKPSAPVLARAITC